jgi:predicted Zn-ribbon and HTH transcriptional regulator
MTDQLNDFTNKSACPKCASDSIAAVKWTWWGGLIGPKILHHHKCASCNFTFNNKTKKSNTTPIIVYFIVISIVFFIAFYFLAGSF